MNTNIKNKNMPEEKNVQEENIYADPRQHTDENKESYLFDDLNRGEVKTHPVAMIVSVLLLILGIFMPIYFGHKYSEEANGLTQKVDKLNKDISVLDKKIEVEKGRGEALNKDLEQKISLLQSPLYRIKWSEVLTELNNVIHNAAEEKKTNRLYTFTSYTATSDGRISITGATNSYSNIATLIEAIEASNMFSDVKFTGSSKTENDEGQSVVTVSLSFSLENPKDTENNQNKSDTNKK